MSAILLVTCLLRRPTKHGFSWLPRFLIQQTHGIGKHGVRSDALVRLARGADLHVQCCYLPAAALTTPQLKGLAEHTLACSDTAGKIAAEAGVKRLVLTDFRSMTPAMLAELERDVRRDFDGPVALARDRDEFAV
jgi:ribonuclease BN (tRNA processing enzyme)